MLNLTRIALLAFPLIALAPAAESPAELPADHAAAFGRVMGATDPAQAELAARKDLAVYSVTARYAAGTISGSLRMHWRNATAEPLTTLVFQAYPNQESWNRAAMTMSSVEVAGQSVVATAMADGPGFSVPLDPPLAPGAEVTVGLTFTHTLSTSGGYHGLGSLTDGVAILHGWFPELAIRRHGQWQVGELPGLCDPARSWPYHAVVHLRLPDGGPIPTSGEVVAEQDLAGPERELTIVSPFTRNLTMLIAPDWQRIETASGGVSVKAWWRSTPEAAKRMLAGAAQALSACGTAFGSYPYREFDVVIAPLGGGVGGVETTGMTILELGAMESVEAFAQDTGTVSLPVLMADGVVAHEVAHAWWYNLVGNDPLAEPWLDESLTNWTTGWILEQKSPALGRTFWQMTHLESVAVVKPPYPAIDTPLWDRGDSVYGSSVYGRGALAYQALRREVGDAAFLACLRDWATSSRWQLVDGTRWRSHLERHFGPDRVAAFWSRWIQGEGLLRTDLDRLLRPAVAGPPSP